MCTLGAHVVGHYADGVRLIGLTDRQLLNKLKILNKANNEIEDQFERSSPYAKVNLVIVPKFWNKKFFSLLTCCALFYEINLTKISYLV